MEEKLNGLFILPLREITLRRIAVVLINKPEYFLEATVGPKGKIQRCYRRIWMQTTWRKIEYTVAKLPLPPLLMKELIPIVKAVGSEILKWKLIHESYLGEFDVYIVTNLCWTSAGTIDYRKTSKKLIHSAVIDITQRFNLACLYCWEDSILALWNELPEESKRHFRGGRDPSEKPKFLLLLPYLLKTHSVQSTLPLIMIRRNCFKYSALYGSKAVTEYSYKMLLQGNRKPDLYQTAVDLIKSRDLREISGDIAPTLETLPDVLCYLLSQMDAEERLRLFMQLPCEILICFLDWPFQDLCLDIADVVWTFLPEIQYEDLLRTIKLHISRLGYFLPNFFQEFFARSPKSFRRCLLNEEYQHCFFFHQFFRAEDSRSFQVIFSNIDARDKEILLFSQKLLELYDFALCRGKRYFLEDFFRKANLSNADLDRLKEAFERSTSNYSWPIDLDWAAQKQTRFSNFIDEIIANTAEKRSIEDEPLNLVKRIRIEHDLLSMLDRLNTSG